MIQFRRLRTQSFCNLPDRSWEFSPGLQLVRGPNEAGKTSLRRALALALYCDAATRDQKVRSQQRWNEDSMLLELEFEHADQVYRVSRDFEHGRNLLELASGKQLRSKEQIREELTKLLVIPTERAFLATACMSHQELRIEDPEDVQSLIERVVCGTGEDVDKFIQDLEKARRLRRKGIDRKTKEPGVLRQIQDRLGQLNADWAESDRLLKDAEEATADLGTCEQDHAVAQEERERFKEHRQRHRDFLQAKKDYDKLSAELVEIEKQLTQEVEFRGQRASLHETLEAELGQQQELETGVSNAKQRAHLVRQLEGCKGEIMRLTAKSQSVKGCNVRLQALRAEESAIPVRRDEAENACEKIPLEIASLGKALAEDSAEQARGRETLTNLEGELVEIRKKLANLEREAEVLEKQREKADQQAMLTRDFPKLEEQAAELDSTINRILALQEEVRSLEAARANLPSEKLRSLRSTVAKLAKAAEGEEIYVKLESERILQVELAADGATGETVAVPCELIFKREARVQVPGVLHIHVENRGRVAAELARAEAELNSLLAESGCAHWEDFERREVGATAVERQLLDRQAELRACLGGQSLESLTQQQLKLAESVAAAKKNLVSLQEEGEVPNQAVVVRKMDKLQGQILELRKAEATVQGRLSALRASFTEGASMRQLRQELERKEGILVAILGRAGVSNPEDLRPVLEEFARIQRERAKTEEELANTLAGARPEDVERLLETARHLASEMEEGLARVADPSWTPEEFEARKLDLQAAHMRCGELQKELVAVEAKLSMLDADKIRQRQASVSRDLVAARATVNQNEQFHLNPAGFLRIEKEISRLEKKIGQYREEVGKLRERTQRQEGLRETKLRAEEEMDWLKRRSETEEFRDEVDGDVARLLALAREQAVAKLQRTLPELAARYLAIATGGRYDRLVGDGLAAGVFSLQKSGVLSETELSSGTADQLYIVKRLAALTALFQRKLPPLLLDDVLVHCDSHRRASVLNLLKELALETQILLFTCQDYPEYAGLPSLNLP